MKPASAPNLTEGTPRGRLDHAFRTVLTVPKEDLLKEEARQKKLRAKKRAKKNI